MRKRNNQFNVRLSDEEDRKLQAIIDHHGVSRVDFVISAIDAEYAAINRQDTIRVPVVGVVEGEKVFWNEPVQGKRVV